jgi:hypothetical protein
MIGLSIHNFHDTYRGFPAAFSADKDGKPLLSWRVHVLPFLEQASLYNQFHLDEPWDSAHNKQLVAQMPSVFRSPASKAEAGKTVYLGLRHKDGVLAPPRDPSRGTRGPVGLSLADITDGTSNTFLVVEASDDRAVIWTKPDDLEVDLNDPLKGLVGQRPGGFLALLCDGSVRFLAANTSPETLKKLITRNGGEPIGDF